MKKKAMEKSIRKILLAPYNLFDEVATANMGELSQFDVIVTNRQLSDEYETYCRNGFVKVIFKKIIIKRAVYYPLKLNFHG